MNAASLSNVSRSFAIDVRLDLKQVADILRLKGSVHLSSILRPPDAKALHDEMEGYRQWLLSLKIGTWDRVLRQDASSLDAAREMEIRDQAYAAATEHAHLYKRALVSVRDTPVLFSFIQFLNSTPFIEFARQVTGYSSIAPLQPRVLSLGPGHFISSHSDEPDSGVHRTNYLFQLAPDWSPDWGGHLEFLDSHGGDVQEAYVPRFNTLSLFATPRWHAVNMVALFAPRNRYTISGFIDSA